MLALPGAPYIYQGEELGMDDVAVPPEQRQDPIWKRSNGVVVGRDGCRSPIPWTADEPGHGFTTGTPWLPFGADAAERNAAVLADDAASTLAVYRSALALRREHVSGGLTWLEAPAGALAFARDGLACALNTSERSVDLASPGGTAVLLGSAPGVTLVDGVLHLPSDTAAWVAT